MRRNKTPFFPLNYTGMIPGQDGPNRGLLNSVGYPVFKASGDLPKGHEHIPLGRAEGSIPKLDHL